MFDHVRTRLALTDYLGLIVVVLVVLASLAAVPLAGIDFDRARPINPVSALVARHPNATRIAASAPLVLQLAPASKTSEVSSNGSL